MWYKLWSKFLRMFGRIKIYPYPMWIIYNPRGYRMSDEDDKSVLDIIQTGDVLLRGYVNFLDTYFIPGYFSHAGLYVGKGEVLHAMQDGVFAEGLMRFLRCDYLVILRPKLTEEEIETVVERAKTLIGTPYDFALDFDNNDRMCCTEFIMAAFQEYKSELRMTYNVKKVLFSNYYYRYVEPDYMLRYLGFDIVFVNSYAKEKLSKLLAEADNAKKILTRGNS